MSRRRRALVTAAFGYAHAALALGLSFLLTPFLLDRLGASTYGLWLASGALLGYAAFAEFGIFGVLPWLVAEADGKKDEGRIRTLVANGLVGGLVVALLYLAVAGALWAVLPSLLQLSAADRQALFGPLALVVGATAAGLPFRVFSSVLLGLQDAAFIGLLNVAQSLLGAGLVFGLVKTGHDLWGPAAALAVPPVVGGIASLLRCWQSVPALLRGWPRPSWASSRPLWSGGLGAWLGAIGWQLASGSDAVVLAALGHRAAVPVFAVTAKLGQTLMQLGWSLPDAGAVGLAQLSAEGDKARTARVAGAMVLLNLLVSGGIACAVLAVNPAFVEAWVGAELFGGLGLNALLAAAIVVLSFVHGVVVPAGVLGNRPLVGAATLANGLVHVGLALWFVRVLGLRGIPVAAIASAALTTLPLGSWVLLRRLGERPGWLLRGMVLPFALRFSPLAAIAGAAGVVGATAGLLVALPVGASMGLAYLFAMRRLYADLPLGSRVGGWLRKLRLLEPEGATADRPPGGSP